jgi:hypothetical protein
VADGAPVLLVTARGERHPLDEYLAEVLLIEGYACFEHVQEAGPGCAREDTRAHATPAAYPLVIVGAGAAETMDVGKVEEYLRGGGRMIVMRPPREWAPLLGLKVGGPLYMRTHDAYIRVNDEHPWLQGWPDRDLQCPGEMHVYGAEGAEILAWLAGQLGEPSVFPVVALHRVGDGAVVTFTYDLADTLVLFQQGRPENASTGANPDANWDGKFCPDDALEGLRDYRLRHIPQADLHRDLLVRAIAGLMADVMPLPRLWHFPDAAPALLFVDGDGDSMDWADMEAAVAIADEEGYPYTVYLQDAQIESFDREAVLALRERGYEFGVHPWTGPQPTLEEWEAEIAGIVQRFQNKFGLAPTSLRAHSCIFPGWDENPRILRRHGLRLDTSVCPGYRFRDGYPNGSALPLRFVDRRGEMLDCWEQSTVQAEDGALTPKVLLPPLTREQGLARAEELMARLVTHYHGVFHPYFHPISIGPRGVQVAEWFRGVLRAARRHGLRGVNATEWLAFNDARMGVRLQGVRWDGNELRFVVRSKAEMEGVTVLLPQWGGKRAEAEEAAIEGGRWRAVVMDLAEGETEVVVRYR